MNKKRFFFFLLLLPFIVGGFESCDLFRKTQEWALQNSVGNIVMVEVAKGNKSSSTFREVGGAWYIYVSGIDPVRLNVEGTINGVTWTFAELTGSGTDVNIIANGGGTADARYPSSTYVSGRLDVTIQYSDGSTISGYDYWSGTRTR